jgi:hypothetical protein
VTDDRDIVLDVWIAIEEFVSSAEDKDSTVQKDKNGNAESNAQSGDAGLPDRGSEPDYSMTD